ncbi:MAG: hypothetical protein HZB33_09095 [Nitrospirae bacterium]|nr:hypothetical protein [Nitrospirota bacterium]
MTWGKNFFKFSILILAVILGNTMLFSPVEAGLFGLGGGSRPERNVASFEKEGRYWGERLKGKKPMD